jgi:hypothetical protein
VGVWELGVGVWELGVGGWGLGAEGYPSRLRIPFGALRPANAGLRRAGRGGLMAAVRGWQDRG